MRPFALTVPGQWNSEEFRVEGFSCHYYIKVIAVNKTSTKEISVLLNRGVRNEPFRLVNIEDFKSRVVGHVESRGATKSAKEERAQSKSKLHDVGVLFDAALSLCFNQESKRQRGKTSSS